MDELGGAGLRREVIAAVNALVNKYPRNRYLITSRLVGYEEAPLYKREFVHHTVLPFSDDDIRRLSKRRRMLRRQPHLVAVTSARDVIQSQMNGGAAS